MASNKVDNDQELNLERPLQDSPLTDEQFEGGDVDSMTCCCCFPVKCGTTFLAVCYVISWILNILGVVLRTFAGQWNLTFAVGLMV